MRRHTRRHTTMLSLSVIVSTFVICFLPGRPGGGESTCHLGNWGGTHPNAGTLHSYFSTPYLSYFIALFFSLSTHSLICHHAMTKNVTFQDLNSSKMNGCRLAPASAICSDPGMPNSNTTNLHVHKLTIFLRKCLDAT
jgi:hypothetical protein